MNSNRNKWTFVVLGILLAAMALCDLVLGSVYISIPEILQIIFRPVDLNAAHSIIIIESRLPKTMTAILAGAALPVAGLMMQTYFRNPVAGPDILGVSAGSGLFVAIVMLTAGSIIPVSIFNNFAIITAAVLGAVAVMLIILSVAWRIRDSVTLLIFGLMFGMAISAVVGVLQYFSDKGALKLFMMWTFGSLGGTTRDEVIILFILVMIGIAVAFFIAKRLNMLLLGEQYAKSLGLNLRATKYIIIIITAVLTGSITAFCGPIAFIGIAVPHITRMICKTNDHFILIPASALTGAIILLLCDIIAQSPGDIGLLPLNSITAFMGAPFIIYIIWKNQHLHKQY